MKAEAEAQLQDLAQHQASLMMKIGELPHDRDKAALGLFEVSFGVLPGLVSEGRASDSAKGSLLAGSCQLVERQLARDISITIPRRPSSFGAASDVAA